MNLETEEMASVLLLAYSLYQQGQFEDAKILADGILTWQPDNAYLHAFSPLPVTILIKPMKPLRNIRRLLTWYPIMLLRWPIVGSSF